MRYAKGVKEGGQSSHSTIVSSHPTITSSHPTITLSHPTIPHPIPQLHHPIPPLHHPIPPLHHPIPPSLTDRHYQPTSFLVLVSENEEYTRLFNELLVILEPLIHLPFSFSIDFELRQVGNVWECVLVCGCVLMWVMCWCVGYMCAKTP